MRELENNKRAKKRKKGEKLPSDPYHSATTETKALLDKFMSLERSWLKLVEKYLLTQPHTSNPELLPSHT